MFTVKLFCSRIILQVILSIAVMLFAMHAHATTRIKDIVDFEGVRDNHLLGYGLVVGLNGSGDNLKNSAFTEKGLMEFLAKLGVNTRGTVLKTKNVAAVTVTARLPAFARHGSKIDVTLGTMGDARSLEGGVLLATPLLGADGEVYAVAQGAVAIGGFHASSQDATVTVSKGVPTSGFISNGGIVEREVPFSMNMLDNFNIALKNPDITTAQIVSETINQVIGDGVARAMDPGTIHVEVPELYEEDIVGLLATIEQLAVQPDQRAKIVVDEASGTIVMGENVRISTVAAAQGNLIVTIKETANFSQPGPFTGDGAGSLAFVEDEVSVEEEMSDPGTKLALLKQAPNLQQLVSGLNALGVRPRDLITILQTIKAAGALQAEIITR